MNFEDRIIEPVAGWLIDPVLKVRIGTAAPRESFDFDAATLFIDYDPELSEENLTQPHSPKIRAVYLATPGAEHLADELEVFRSDRSLRLETIDIDWVISRGVMRVHVGNDLKRLRFTIDSIKQANVPDVSDQPEAFLLEVIRSIPLFSALRGDLIKKHCPDLRSIEVYVNADAASQLFGIVSPVASLEPARQTCVSKKELPA